MQIIPATYKGRGVCVNLARYLMGFVTALALMESSASLANGRFIESRHLQDLLN